MVMSEFGTQKKLIKLIKIILDEIECKGKIQSDISRAYDKGMHCRSTLQYSTGKGDRDLKHQYEWKYTK